MKKSQLKQLIQEEIHKVFTEIKINRPYNPSFITPEKEENLRDFANRVYKHFTNTNMNAFGYIDKTKSGYSSKLTNQYSEDGMGVPKSYNDAAKYLIDFFSSPKWKDLIQVKLIPDGNIAVVRFLTKEHPKNTILK